MQFLRLFVALSIFTAAQALVPFVVRDAKAAKQPTFTLTPAHLTGNKSLDDAAQVVRTVVSLLLSGGNIEKIQKDYITDDYVERVATSLPYKNSVYLGHAGLDSVFTESQNIFRLNHTTVDVYALTPNLVICKYFDPGAISVSTNESWTYDVSEEVFVRDGKYAGTKPYYWDQYGYQKAYVKKAEKKDRFGYLKYQTNQTNFKLAQIKKYTYLFTGN